MTARLSVTPGVIVVTWNVNSIGMRLERLEALLARHRSDVLCMLELKAADVGFPADRFEALGYSSAVFGQAGPNGVSIVSRVPCDAVTRGFRGDPMPEQARVITGSVAAMHVINAYVVNGKALGSAEYGLKLAWLDALGAWLRDSFDPASPLLVVGDFVAPHDRDVHDPDRWRGLNLCSEPERARIRALLAWGLVDLVRLHDEGPGPFTWWDYRAEAFHRGWGLRLDLALGTRPVVERCTRLAVDRDERKPTFGEGKPSDQAPLIVTLRDGGR